MNSARPRPARAGYDRQHADRFRIAGNGLEPLTIGLYDRCSTSELTREPFRDHRPSTGQHQDHTTAPETVNTNCLELSAVSTGSIVSQLRQGQRPILSTDILRPVSAQSAAGTLPTHPGSLLRKVAWILQEKHEVFLHVSHLAFPLSIAFNLRVALVAQRIHRLDIIAT